MKEIGYGRKMRISTALGPCGAVHEIREGKKTPLGFYVDNPISLYVQEGVVVVRSIMDGRVRNADFSAGNAVTIPRGTLFQLLGKTDARVVEFGSNASSYTDGSDDFRIIEHGTPLEEARVEDMPSVVMTDLDKQKLEESKVTEEDSAAKEERPAPKKKTTRKKKTTTGRRKKATSKKN